MSRPPKKHIFEVVEKAPTTLDYALQYIELGWYLLPVWGVNDDGSCRCGLLNDAPGHKPGKHPQANLAPRGHLDATSNPDIARDWWATDPDAGIGISLAQSGLVALDIDPRNGGDETLAKIESQHGVLYSDCVAVTQSGGEHRLFRAEENTSYPSSIGSGLDMKHNGYIVVAPSLGELGPYRWHDNKSPIAKVNPVVPSELPKFITDRTRAKTEAYEVVEKSGVPVATAQTFDDLRDALTYISSDEYNTWVQVGMALKPYGENGYSVWMDWSSKSPKFDATVSRRKWDVLDEPHSITFKSIFRSAIDNGWVSRVGTTPKSVDEIHPLSLKNDQGSGSHSIKPLEWIMNDYMSTGINVLAGSPGVGKTTLVIPLALSVAHIYPVDYQLIPSIRRNVIIISEAVQQVQRIIYSVATFGNTGAREEDFDSVKVIPARRLKADIVVQVADEYKEWTYPNEMADGGTFHAAPLVVFDTANAVFDAEENDNSEVGRIMAALKTNFSDMPVIIIAHTAKALGSGESDMLSPRGASAWTGDAQGVYTMFKDEVTEDRILQTTKVRFPTDYNELTFTLVSNSEHHKDVLGYDDILYFTHAYARPLKDGERKSSK